MRRQQAERDRKLQQTGVETEDERKERVREEEEAKRRFNAMLEKEGQAMKQVQRS